MGMYLKHLFKSIILSCLNEDFDTLVVSSLGSVNATLQRQSCERGLNSCHGNVIDLLSTPLNL